MLGLLAVMCKPDGRRAVLPPVTEEAFSLLQRFAKFHMVDPECTTDEELHRMAGEAREWLLEYAKLAEIVRCVGGFGAARRDVICHI